jgi:hypothetical protein
LTVIKFNYKNTFSASRFHHKAQSHEICMKTS